MSSSVARRSNPTAWAAFWIGLLGLVLMPIPLFIGLILGGGLSRVPELIDGLPAAIAPHVFSDVFDTPVRAGLHGDASGVRGAAWLWEAPI